jgi:hypothetical protein
MASELRGSSDVILRRHGRDPSVWELTNHVDAAKQLLPKRKAIPEALNLAIFTLGGLGDDLTKLNLTRQLVGRLRETYPLLHVTWVGRQEYSFFPIFDFIDAWRYLGANRHINDASAIIVEEYDLTLELRYQAQFLWPGNRWVGEGYEGLDATTHICESLAQSCGKYAFSDDGNYLSWFLDQVHPTDGEQRRLRRLVGSDPYVVVANGTDPLFRDRLVKAIPPGTIYQLCNYLNSKGIRTVQVGKGDVDYIEAANSVNLIGNTSLEGLISLLRGSLGFFACEGGVAHLGSQMGKKGVVLFGPTPPEFWGYPGNLNLTAPKSKCNYQPCWFHRVDGKVDLEWHERCYAAEKHELELIRTFPHCMGMFDPETVAKQTWDFLTKGEEGVIAGLRKPPSWLSSQFTRLRTVKEPDTTFRREDWMTVQWVTDRIAIGDKESAKTIGLLQREGITASFNVSDDAVLTTRATNIEGAQIGLIDGAGNSVSLLEAAERKVRALLVDHDKILVHCRAGISRSATVCALHLVKTGAAKDFKAAIRKVQLERPQCLPDPDLALTAEAVVAGWKGRPRV